MQDIFNDMDKVIAKFSDDMREMFKDYHKEEKQEEKKEPRIGALCKFWDDDIKNSYISILDPICGGSFSYKTMYLGKWENCRELTKEELLEIPNIKELLNEQYRPRD